ncbi:MAG: post-transcriptional regulator [Bacilli bacterium]
MDIQFDSLEQLYERLKPALNAKQQEMIRQGYKYIKQTDIWNYLKEVKWQKDSNLSLYEMVNDVLNTDNIIIDAYLKDKLNLKEREIYFG